MKSILVLALLSVVLVMGISQAEAYEGKINVTVGIQNEDYYRGDTIPVEIRLIGDIDIMITDSGEKEILVGEPNSDTSLKITIIDSVSGTTIMTENIIPEWKFQENGDDPLWVFEYSIDTNELKGDIQYTLETQYDDKVDSYTFSFYMTPEESAIRSGQALSEGKLIINPDEPQPELVDQTTPIPEWVDNIFVWYGQGQITQDELISTLQYLITIGILKI